jgi:AcrR family transcriptional regulator
MSLSSGVPSPPLKGLPSGPSASLAAGFPAASFTRLPIGRNQFPREVLDQHHRNRVLIGAVASLAECGYRDASVERLIVAAGVSRHTFYAHFPDKEACYLAAYDRAVEWLEQEATAALAGADGWADKVGTAVESTLVLLAANPGVARLAAAEILCIGPAGQARRRTLVDRLIPVMCLGPAERPASAVSTPRLELALLSGVFSMVDREVSGGRGERLAELAPDLTEFLLLPYLGPAKARRVARRRPVPGR